MQKMHMSSDKNYCWISSYDHAAELNWKWVLLYTRNVLWSRICRKCVCGRGSAPDTTGELTTLPRPPSRMGRGQPSPDLTPFRAFGASTLTPPTLGSAPRTHNFWLRQWYIPENSISRSMDKTRRHWQHDCLLSLQRR